MAEEFGDLLLQIVLNAQIASEDGEFNMADVLKGIHDKIIRRHPHVFGDVKLDGVQGVLKNWEKLKAVERANSQEPEKGLLDGVPLALPALSRPRNTRIVLRGSVLTGRKSAVCWKDRRRDPGGTGKSRIEEELTAELGDLFFALVNLARWKKVDAESALRGDEYALQEALCLCGTGSEETGKKTVRDVHR